jgi:hypothetical protein
MLREALPPALERAQPLAPDLLFEGIGGKYIHLIFLLLCES